MDWNGFSDTHFSAIAHQNAKSLYPLSSNACNGPKLPDRPTLISGDHGRLHCLARRYLGSPGGRGLPSEDHRFRLASDCGLLSPDLAAGIRRVKGARRLGVRIGNWLTVEEGRRLVGAFGASTPKERRNRAMIAVLLGCGLRRAEAAALKLEDFQLRDGRWVIADLNGKGGHIRTVPVPDWVKKVIDEWTVPAGLTSGPLFRAINKAGRTWGNGFRPKVIWSIVREGAASCGLAGLPPHDLRRTCARLCHQAGGELEQIQFLLGHISIETTERYLGCKQHFQNAVNDAIGLEPGGS